ncbi:similar to Saccharomyces cerevisiae YPL054W LEE1 Zinc-finger protein of unknown function [Maudiozyma saulgeensis]|uniref:C3H1-type domain-containing protein n=1 Tax=Maudiozyma saulgeensis TaxID=1789683 RepID=A0A1X7R6C0_9SACH|nr:similar to Saccharomyces cerevisiae YPL054W LEE1 Zinc-finger protein of unknown function [Kazachstania saulgeensis]
MTKNLISHANIAANNPPCVDFPDGVQWTDFPESQRKTIIECLMVTQNNRQNGKSYDHIPCKFFKKGKCQAGRTCPFSHRLDYDEACKTPCLFYLRGECKFGDKCLNLHEKLPKNGIKALNSNQNNNNKWNNSDINGNANLTTPTSDANYIIANGNHNGTLTKNFTQVKSSEPIYKDNIPRYHDVNCNGQNAGRSVQESAPITSNGFSNLSSENSNNYEGSTSNPFPSQRSTVNLGMDLETSIVPRSNISPELEDSISKPVYNYFAEPEGFPIWSKSSGAAVVGANNTHGKTNYYNTNYFDFNEPITRPLHTTPTGVYDGNSFMRKPTSLAIGDVKYFINGSNQNTTNKN